MGFWDTVKDIGSYIPGVGLGMKIYDSYAADDEARTSLVDGGGAGYEQRGAKLDSLSGLLDAEARGQGPSLADEAAKRNFGRAIAGQQALATGARPGMQGFATRAAMQNTSHLQAQQAQEAMMGRLAERQAARQNLGNLLLGARGQDVQAATAALQTPSAGQQMVGGLMGIGQAAAMMSDENLKTNIEDGSEDVDAFMDVAEPYSFDYIDEKHGEGRQTGVMAQRLEEHPIARRAVIQTPEGKAVDFGRLGALLTASVGRLNRRLKDLEE